MTRVWLVRHGSASAQWWQDRDPGLSPVGRAEALAAVHLLDGVGPLPLVTSPLARTRETAGVFASAWGKDVAVEPAVSEVPSPVHDLDGRQQWLQEFLGGYWSTQPPALWDWRHALLEFLCSLGEPTVVVTHAVAINTVLAEANGDDRVFSHAVAPGSVTVIDVEPGPPAALTVVAVGARDDTVRLW